MKNMCVCVGSRLTEVSGWLSCVGMRENPGENYDNKNNSFFNHLCVLCLLFFIEFFINFPQYAAPHHPPANPT